MENADLWLTPLILLPGIGLLIMSTVGRYEALRTELRQMTETPGDLLMFRARRYRNAMSGLYLSGGVFAITTMLHGLLKNIAPQLHWPVVLLSYIGLISLIYALVELFRESLVSLHDVERRLNQNEG